MFHNMYAQYKKLIQLNYNTMQVVYANAISSALSATLRSNVSNLQISLSFASLENGMSRSLQYCCRISFLTDVFVDLDFETHCICVIVTSGLCSVLEMVE